MKTHNLAWESNVLAFDRVSHCLRVLDGNRCEIVDPFGQKIRDGYEFVDTDSGEIRYRSPEGDLKIERHRFLYIVVADAYAVRLSRP